VQLVADAVIRARSGIKDPRRPIAASVPRPTGSARPNWPRPGRSVVRQRDNLVRIDMSEYMEKHAVSRLIGAAGLCRLRGGGQLTEAVRRKPYSVVLFDEIEKAHPDVFHVLLQILDDGRATDAQGARSTSRTRHHHDLEHRAPILLEGITPDGVIARPRARR